MTQAKALPTKAHLIALLASWIAQRPGLEFANYGDVSSYRSEMRSITKDGAVAKQLLRYVEMMDSISAEDIIEGFRAFSGRLSLVLRNDEWTLDYCTGQYWPTEYRRAAAAVLSSVIWNYWRSDIPMSDKSAEELQAFLKMHKAANAGDYLRKKAVREFGRGRVASFFN